MKPRFKIGLIAGFVWLTLSFCTFACSLSLPITMLLPFFGIFLALLVGAAAGFIAAQQERVLMAKAGARVGAISGGIAGAIMFIGPMLMAWSTIGILLLVFSQGEAAMNQEDQVHLVSLISSSFLMGLGSGIAILVAALLGGAAGGYLRASSSTAESVPSVK